MPRSGLATLPPVPLTAREAGAPRSAPCRAPSLGPCREGGAAQGGSSARASSWHSSVAERHESAAPEREREQKEREREQKEREKQEREREHKELERERRRAAAEERKLSELERKVAAFADHNAALEARYGRVTQPALRDADADARTGGYPSPRPPVAARAIAEAPGSDSEDESWPRSPAAALEDRAPPEPSPWLLEVEREREMWDAKLLGLRAGLSFAESRPGTAAAPATSTRSAGAGASGAAAAPQGEGQCGDTGVAEVATDSEAEDVAAAPDAGEAAEEVDEEDEEEQQEEPGEGRIAAALRSAGIEASSLAEAMAILERRAAAEEAEEADACGGLSPVAEAPEGPAVGIGPAEAPAASRPTSAASRSARRWAAERARRKREACGKRSNGGTPAGSRAETPLPG